MDDLFAAFRKYFQRTFSSTTVDHKLLMNAIHRMSLIEGTGDWHAYDCPFVAHNAQLYASLNRN